MILGQFAYGKVYLGFGVQGLEIKLQRVGFGALRGLGCRVQGQGSSASKN